MNIYVVVRGGSRVQCVALECGVDLWSAIDLWYWRVRVGQYNFPARFVKYDGTKGHIDTMWQYLMCIECKDPSLVEQCKFSLYRADKKFVEKTAQRQRGRADLDHNAKINACFSYANERNEMKCNDIYSSTVSMRAVLWARPCGGL